MCSVFSEVGEKHQDDICVFRSWLFFSIVLLSEYWKPTRITAACAGPSPCKVKLLGW